MRDNYQLFTLSLALFGPAVLLFTVHYLMLRGFYALELNRTVFWIQCAVAATNIVVALAVAVHATDAEHTSPALVVAYAASYAVGSVLSYTVLRRRLGGLETPRPGPLPGPDGDRGGRSRPPRRTSCCSCWACWAPNPTNLVAALRAFLVTAVDVGSSWCWRASCACAR